MKTYHRFKFGTIQEWKAEKDRLAPFVKMRADAIERMIAKEEQHLKDLKAIRRQRRISDVITDFVLGSWRVRA